MPSPRVSVVVTCYNLGGFLDEAIDSVLAQTFEDVEIVVVDDGSTDPATVRLLDDYRRPKTRVVRIENRGLPGARNAGIARSTGEYVCTLDADDVLAPTWLEKAAARLDADPSLAFVSHWFRTFGDETWEWTPTACDLPALLDANTVNGAALVRRSALQAVGGFDERLRHGCEDWALWLAMVEHGLRGAIIPEVLFFYRRRPDSMSRVMIGDGAYLENVRLLLERHRASYRHHLPELLVQRERRTARLLRAIHDLETEHDGWLAPTVARRREEVAALRAKAERVAGDRRRDEALAETRARVEALERSAAAARTEILRLDAAANDAERRARELRASLSWRLTAPLRALYGRLARARRGP